MVNSVLAWLEVINLYSLQRTHMNMTQTVLYHTLSLDYSHAQFVLQLTHTLHVNNVHM